MDFGLDETQQSIADLSATVLRNEVDGARVDQVVSSELGYDETLWKALGQAGLLTLAVPEALGGDGFGAIELAAVLSEVGRQTLPLPALATLASGVLPIATFGSAAQQAALLPEVADGRVLSAALRDNGPRQLAAVRDGSAFVLSGTKIGVPYAAQAHRVLVGSDAGVFVVDPRADGVILTRTPTSTGSPEYTMTLAGLRLAESDLLTTDVRGVERFAIAGACAIADGVISAALALTAGHLATRHQFGKPLATFQAVAQEIADVYITGRTVHLAATSVNWRLAAGVDADDDLDIAAYWVASELPTALQVCHHLHGGLGVDHTYPLHRYYSHAKDLARFVGGAAQRLDLIGARCSSN